MCVCVHRNENIKKKREEKTFPHIFQIVMMMTELYRAFENGEKKTNHKATRFNKLRAESFDDWNLSIARRTMMRDHNVCHDSY